MNNHEPLNRHLLDLKWRVANTLVNETRSRRYGAFFLGVAQVCVEEARESTALGSRNRVAAGTSRREGGPR